MNTVEGIMKKYDISSNPQWWNDVKNGASDGVKTLMGTIESSKNKDKIMDWIKNNTSGGDVGSVRGMLEDATKATEGAEKYLINLKAPPFSEATGRRRNTGYG
jgi:hypothetical protein